MFRHNLRFQIFEVSSRMLRTRPLRNRQICTRNYHKFIAFYHIAPFDSPEHHPTGACLTYVLCAIWIIRWKETRNSQRLLLNGSFEGENANRSPRTCVYSSRAYSQLYTLEISASVNKCTRQSLNGVVRPDARKRQQWPCLIILFRIMPSLLCDGGVYCELSIARECFTFHLFKAKPRRTAPMFPVPTRRAIVGLISHKSPVVFVDWVTVSFVPRSERHRFRSEVIKCRDRHVARYRISRPHPLLQTCGNMILTLSRKTIGQACDILR